MHHDKHYKMHSSAQKLPLFALLAITLIGSCVGATPRTCYTCSGINCMRTTLSTTEKCLDPLDYCMTVFDKFSVVHKGCSLEVPVELRRRCDARDSMECHKCNTDRCNTLGQANSMCLVCDSSKDANCAKTPMSLTATRCAAPTAPNSYCYVKYENSATKRGCAVTVEEQQQCYADGNCLLCSPDDILSCNSVDFAPGTRSMRF